MSKILGKNGQWKIFFKDDNLLNNNKRIIIKVKKNIYKKEDYKRVIFIMMKYKLNM